MPGICCRGTRRGSWKRYTRRSGYPIKLVEEDAVGFDSEIRLARAGSATYEVAYDPDYRKYAVHFFGERHAQDSSTLRMSSRGAIRCCPRSRSASSCRPGREIRQNVGPHLDETGVRAVSEILFNGMVRQVTSFRIDLRVERELYDDLCEHRTLQRAYMKRQVTDLEPHFTAEVEAPAPSRIYAMATAMNVVLAEEVAEMCGRTVGPLVRSSGHRAMGTRLRQILREEREPGYRGDCRITDAWAAELRMRDWYEWAPKSLID
jgi:hypothetical protein